MSTVIKKTNILRKEFREYDINNDEYINYKQLNDVLDIKAKKLFDRDISQQLYDRMSYDHAGRFTVDEFIKVWIEAESILTIKIETSKKYLQDFHRQRKDVLGKINTQPQEIYNQFGMMKGSHLDVNLKDGKYFPSTSFYTVLKINEQKYETEQKDGPSPHWNQQFKFEIDTGLEELQIFFFSGLHCKNPSLIGTLTVTLSGLMDQDKHETQIQLFDKDGRNTGSYLTLGLQLNFSKVKQYNEKTLRWNQNIQQQEDDLLDNEKQLASLYEPFPSIIQVYQSIDEQEKKENKTDIYPANTLINTQIYNPKNHVDSENNSRMLTMSLLMLSVLACFQKAQFLDIMICISYISLFERKLLMKQVLQWLSVAIALSTLMDLLWLVEFSEEWWDSQLENNHDFTSIEEGSLRLSLIMIYTSLFLKVLTAISYFHQSTKSQNIQQMDTNDGNIILKIILKGHIQMMQ